MNDKTNWVALPGYKGIYEVSDTGSVRRVDTGKVLRVQRENTKAARVRVSRDGKERSIRIDELVRLAAKARSTSSRRSSARKSR